MRLRFASVVVALSSLAISCSGAEFNPGNHCTTNADCSGGSTCDTTHQLCVAPNGSFQVVFVGSPPGNRITPTAATTATAPQDVSAASSTPIVLSAPRTVYGRVDVSGASGSATTPIAATLRFRRQGATPAEADIEVQSAAALQTADNRTFSYSAQLIPQTYDVTVTPSDLSQTPPYFLTGQVIDRDANSAPAELAIVYSPPDPAHGYVTGRVLDAMTHLPMPSVPIQIVDPAANNRVVSTVQQTSDGSDHQPVGSFHLWVGPGATDHWSLQMISQPMAAAMPSPNTAVGRLVYQVTRAALGAVSTNTDLTLQADSSLSLSGSVSGTCLACVDVEASVEGNSAAGMRETIAGATVSLRADNVLGALPTGQTAWFEAQTTTAADGTFSARLMPGTYSVVITPPRDSQYAITSLRLEVTRSQRGQVLTVHPLVPVLGVVLSDANSGQGVGGASVEAVPLIAANVTPSATMPVTQLARRYQVNTENDGSFALPLDEGNYLLVVHPPTGSGLATQLFNGTQVVFNQRNGDTDPRPVPISRGNLVIASPFTVSNVVQDSLHTPLTGATVRAFARYRSSDGPALDIEIARATTDGMGTYSLLLPSQ